MPVNLMKPRKGRLIFHRSRTGACYRLNHGPRAWRGGRSVGDMWGYRTLGQITADEFCDLPNGCRTA
jgi:hypothetical protein